MDSNNKSFLFFGTLSFRISQRTATNGSALQGSAPGSESWTWEEKANQSNVFNKKVVYNVSHRFTCCVFCLINQYPMERQ